MKTSLDHIVVGAATLEQGVAYVREQLGVDIPKGGEHPLMATHNHLMRLGNDTFLEVIAINAVADTPVRPRWFGLDDPAVLSSLENQPRLLTWVVNTTSLEDLQGQVNFDLGVTTALSRGELNWLFAVPDDGRLLAGGMLPNVMQWQTRVHPSRTMADLNCRLHKLNIYHPYPQWLLAQLDSLNASELVVVHTLNGSGAAYITAEIETPERLVVLSSSLSDQVGTSTD